MFNIFNWFKKGKGHLTLGRVENLINAQQDRVRMLDSVKRMQHAIPQTRETINNTNRQIRESKIIINYLTSVLNESA